MGKFITYEEALGELQACERAFGQRYPCKIVFPTGKSPILTELHFGKETRNLTVRMIDLDNGMWAFSIARPNKHGIMHAEAACWYGPTVKEISHLMFCVGCGDYPGRPCRHASGYTKNIVQLQRTTLTHQLRRKLLELLQSA
jgi:hypothetical protein